MSQDTAQNACPILYGYFRSSAAYRVRIALNLKEIEYEHRCVHMLKDGGQQKSAANLARNPQALVPSLEIDGGILTQSLAILDYLEETRPTPQLLPAMAIDKAQVRAFCQSIACEIHPLNNLRVLNYLMVEMGVTDQQKLGWYRHWVEQGLRQSAALLRMHGKMGPFCYGAEPSLADCVLVPQLYNARRFECDLSGLDDLLKIDAACHELPAFIDAHPENQSDAPGTLPLASK